MIKLHKYDVNVYKQYNNFYYKCESNKQRNSLLDFLYSFGVTIPKDYEKASASSKYLKISRKLKKVCLYANLGKYGNQFGITKCNLKQFVNLFKLCDICYTIYGKKIKI